MPAVPPAGAPHERGASAAATHGPVDQQLGGATHQDRGLRDGTRQPHNNRPARRLRDLPRGHSPPWRAAASRSRTRAWWRRWWARATWHSGYAAGATALTAPTPRCSTPPASPPTPSIARRSSFRSCMPTTRRWSCNSAGRSRRCSWRRRGTSSHTAMPSTSISAARSRRRARADTAPSCSTTNTTSACSPSYARWRRRCACRSAVRSGCSQRSKARSPSRAASRTPAAPSSPCTRGNAARRSGGGKGPPTSTRSPR